MHQAVRTSVYRTPSSPSQQANVVEHRIKVSHNIAPLKPAWEVMCNNPGQQMSKRELLELCPATNLVEQIWSSFNKGSLDAANLTFSELCAFVLVKSNHGTGEEKLELVFPMCSIASNNPTRVSDLVGMLKQVQRQQFPDSEFDETKTNKLVLELTHFVHGAASRAPETAEAVAASVGKGADDTDVVTQEPAPVVEGDEDISGTANQKTAEEPVLDAKEVADDLGPHIEQTSGGEPQQVSSDEVHADPEVTMAQFAAWARSAGDCARELREALHSPPSSLAAAFNGSDIWWLKSELPLERIRVDTPIVELDGDEMARIVWQMIKEKLIYPFLDMELDYFDLSITYRDETDDQVLEDAARAIEKYGVGVKCSTIVPDNARLLEFNLRQLYECASLRLPRLIGGNTVFHSPIVLDGSLQPLQRWTKPVIFACPASANPGFSLELDTKGPGSLKVDFVPDNGDVQSGTSVLSGTGPRIVTGVWSERGEIEEYAHSCFQFALSNQMPLCVSTTGTVMKAHDSLVADVFNITYQGSFQKAFEEAGLWFQQGPTDLMLGELLRSQGGIVWAVSSFETDILLPLVVHGCGSAGLATSLILSPNGRTFLAEASHGTMRRHYRNFKMGERPTVDPLALVFTWTQGLAHRARLDGNQQLAHYCRALEEACITCVQSKQVSKGIAMHVNGASASPEQWLDTQQLLDAYANELRIVLSKPPRLPQMAQAAPFA